MRLLVFVTDDGSATGSGPVLFIRDDPSASLPPNPRSLQWRYLINIDADEQMFATEGGTAREAVERNGYYVSDRTIDAARDLAARVPDKGD